jgi:DNA-binding IclR family transcriptional regulator
MSEEKEEKSVATLERALLILGTFDASTTQSLADIARRTGLYKSTLLRLLSTLEKFGYVGQQRDGDYHIGVAGLHLGSLYQRWVKPAELIIPLLKDLVAETGESASFNIQEGDLRVCVYRVDSPHKIRDHVRVGDLLPLDQGAAGKVLIAFGQGSENPQWEELRQACFCFTAGEIEPDTAAIASPVFSLGEKLEGALAITGPAFRFTPAKVKESCSPLLKAAAMLSRSLGANVSRFERAQHLHERNEMSVGK